MSEYPVGQQLHQLELGQVVFLILGAVRLVGKVVWLGSLDPGSYTVTLDSPIELLGMIGQASGGAVAPTMLPVPLPVNELNVSRASIVAWKIVPDDSRLARLYAEIRLELASRKL